MGSVVGRLHLQVMWCYFSRSTAQRSCGGILLGWVGDVWEHEVILLIFTGDLLGVSVEKNAQALSLQDAVL